MTTPLDPHGRLALPDMAIAGHTLEQLHDWLYGQLADAVPRTDLRYLAGTTTDAMPLPYNGGLHCRFTPGDTLFGVLVV